MRSASKLFAYLLIAFGVWGSVLLGLFTFAFFTTHDRVFYALMGMVCGLGYGCIVCGGLLMWRFREPKRALVLRMRLDWRLKFVHFATLPALSEEAVTTLTTNLAPQLRVPMGRA